MHACVHLSDDARSKDYKAAGIQRNRGRQRCRKAVEHPARKCAQTNCLQHRALPQVMKYSHSVPPRALVRQRDLISTSRELLMLLSSTLGKHSSAAIAPLFPLVALLTRECGIRTAERMTSPRITEAPEVVARSVCRRGVHCNLFCLRTAAVPRRRGFWQSRPRRISARRKAEANGLRWRFRVHGSPQGSHRDG